MKTLKDLNVKIFADGADLEEMKKIYKDGSVSGFTTNPTLMRKAGVLVYEKFAKEVLSQIKDLPISFEAFSDDFAEMEKEARLIAGWAPNVNIKIPITNARGQSSIPLIKKLSADGLSLNVTAILPLEQVEDVALAVSKNSQTIVSVFAGRIADTGRDPVPHMKKAALILKDNKNAKLLWASSRELLNIFQADEAGCHIITVTPDILKKLRMIGKDLKDLSLDTVKMFYNDCCASGYRIL